MGREASRAVFVPGPMADQAVQGAMAERAVQGVMVEQGAQGAMAEQVVTAGQPLWPWPMEPGPYTPPKKKIP